jgi:hypothetical protein
MHREHGSLNLLTEALELICLAYERLRGLKGVWHFERVHDDTVVVDLG